MLILVIYNQIYVLRRVQTSKALFKYCTSAAESPDARSPDLHVRDILQTSQDITCDFQHPDLLPLVVSQRDAL